MKKLFNLIVWGGGIIGAVSSAVQGDTVNAFISIICALIGTELMTQYRLGKMEEAVNELKLKVKKLEDKKHG